LGIDPLDQISSSLSAGSFVKSSRPITPLNNKIEELRSYFETTKKPEVNPFRFSENVNNGDFTFDLLTNGNNLKTYSFEDVSKCEFLGFSENEAVVAFKSTEKTVDILDGKSLECVCKLDAEQPKCILFTSKYVLIGTWHAQVMVYDMEENFKFVKVLKTKAATRTICLFNQTTVLVG